MSVRDRAFLAGWQLAAQAITRGLLDTSRKAVEHDVRVTVADATRTLRNASRVSRGYVAGLRAAVGFGG